MLIITGTGRSGTTAMIRFIERMGFDLGNRGDYDYNEEIRGGVENRCIRELNKRLRSSIKDGRLDIEFEMPAPGGKRTRIADQINAVKVDAYKELVLFTNPAIIRAWWESRKDISVLVCHRRFDDMYRSVVKREAHFGKKPQRTPEDFKIQFADFLTEIMLLGIPHRILMFPDFLSDYDSVYEALAALGMDFDIQEGAKVWGNLIDFDLVTETPGFKR